LKRETILLSMTRSGDGGVALGLTAEDVDRLVDLFREPITWSERIVLKDGGHRVHALRGAGVERVVVYTGKRELDAEGLWQDAD
jgi:ParB-like chromosome segregation protein Spo0J